MNYVCALKPTAKKLARVYQSVVRFLCHHPYHCIEKDKIIKRSKSSCPLSLSLRTTNIIFGTSLYLLHAIHSTSESSLPDAVRRAMEKTANSGSTLSNIEIKAKIHNLEVFLQKARAITDQPEVILKQEDTYFRVHSGRFKLREIQGHYSQLVYYDRPDTEGPKLSRYKKQDFKNADEVAGLKEILEASLGIVGVVRKKRHLFMVGHTRIHVDEVENLGHFMELEVVMQEGQDVTEGQVIADTLMSVLNISKEDLLPCSYIDLTLQ